MQCYIKYNIDHIVESFMNSLQMSNSIARRGNSAKPLNYNPVPWILKMLLPTISVHYNMV